MSATKRKPDNLYQRNGVWWIRYNANGRKIRSSLGTKSERQAKRLRDEILGKRSAAEKFGLELPVPKQEPLFEDVAERWLQSRRANGDLKPNTVAIFEQHMRVWLRPAFRGKRMSEITVEEIERLLAQLRQAKSKRTGRPLSRHTIARIYGALLNLYRHAVRRGWYTGANPLDKLERPPTPGPGREVVLTVEEAPRLLDELSGELYYKAALALQTGLRWGEIHGLAWDDIDLDAEQPTITVRRSWRETPKTEASAATLPLHAEVAALLRRWRQEQGPGARYLFPDRHGALRTRQPNGDPKAIRRAAERAGIGKHLTPHVFRHTFGTWVYETTRDPKMVQRLMRHSSFATSMGYVHDQRDLNRVIAGLPSIAAPRLKAA